MTLKKQNERIVNKWHGYYLEDLECQWCLYYISKKRGCSLTSCCCEEEKLDAIKQGRIKRRKGAMEWDG